ncbi:MAG: TerC/Alx family metal homeostasis membrane protein [Thaumarchaeota archaeon]|jgi:tellurite resistance protein TerC|nr:TerC/Alx family metal homeostasis membrane protein [Candidatus Geocrenenecus arthurdayi]
MVEVTTIPHHIEIQVPMWFWELYHAVIIVFIAIDLLAGVRRKHAMTYKEAGAWSALWIAVGLAWGVFVYWFTGPEKGLEALGLYYAAFVVEKCLSMDNLFVFAVIFSYFSVPLRAQPIVLYVGILTAIILRATFIAGGLWLIEQFHWTIYIFGAVLIYSGYKLLRAGEVRVDPTRNPVVKFAQRFLPMADYYDGAKFIVRSKQDGKLLFTPLILALLAIETSDIIFAFDSVPAVIAITMNFFLAYTSNISAILGLRALYFLIAITMFRFKYVGPALAGILVFLGIKIFVTQFITIPVWLSISIVFTVLGAAIILSIMKGGVKKEIEE